VDLLLVAYDGAQFYRVFACASDAAEAGKLDLSMLRDSEARLRRNAPETERPPVAPLIAARPAG
jgi:beta-N-acetylhexosaminidase